MTEQTTSHSVIFVSDRTGKTAESIGLSLLSQFDSVEFVHKTYSFVSTMDDVRQVVDDIHNITRHNGTPPVVISTIVNEDIEAVLAGTNACLISLFNAFLDPLERHLGIESSHSSGHPHEEYDDKGYNAHIDAIEFTLNNDDGTLTTQFKDADVILVGVSRCAKTPTCLYLAMNFSIKAANYPLTNEDLDKHHLPGFLQKHIDKIVGLTIRPDRLSTVRQQRRPNSDYASLDTCKKEIRLAEAMMQRAGLSVFDTTCISIEEIAVKIAREKNLLNRKYVMPRSNRVIQPAG